MKLLDISEKQLLSSFFNDNGYVLNFSDSSFNTFTYNSIGVAVKLNTTVYQKENL